MPVPTTPTPLPPHQLWRQRFCRAIEKEDSVALDSLLGQWSADPTLSWASVTPPYPQDPLSFAFVRENVWGITQILERGLEINPEMIEGFFGLLERSRVANDMQGQRAVEKLWRALLPGIVRSPACRRQVIGFYFELEKEEKLPKGVDWAALSISAVLGEWLDEPVLQAWGLNVTPLQYASIHHLHSLVETLLTHGANGHAEQPRSDMPGWSLAKGVVAAQTSKEERWSSDKVERYVWKEWCHSSQDPSEMPSGQRLPAKLWFFGMRTMGDQGFRKQNILALLRGQQLEEALPSAAPSRKGPRF